MQFSDDMREAFYKNYKIFCNPNVDEAARFDEEHLLPIALDVFALFRFRLQRNIYQ